MVTKIIIDSAEFYSHHPRMKTRWIGAIVTGLMLAIVVADVILTIFARSM